MSKVLVSEENLTNIANAIREKNGETTTYKPGDMATAIQNISSGGGGDPELEASFVSLLDGSLGANCTKLPDSLTSIGEYAFESCENLALTELPSGLINIEGNAFYNCTNLALTELPNSLVSIGDYAFEYCSNLALTKLPNSLISIGELAFDSCTKLALTELPDNLTSISYGAFSYCPNITFKELPTSITIINSCVFQGCEGLTKLSLKGNITNINQSAFDGCTGLGAFVLPNVTSTPTLGRNVFKNTPIASGTGYIYVPDTLVDSFKSATNWSVYADQIKPISELEVA